MIKIGKCDMCVHFINGDKQGHWVDCSKLGEDVKFVSGADKCSEFVHTFGQRIEDSPKMAVEEPQTVRERVLDKARQIVSCDRESQYGTPEDNFGVIANFWSVYLDTEVTKKDVALMMALLKIARESTGVGKWDNFVDLIGYAACGAEMVDCE